MRNTSPFSRFYNWVYRKLYVESDDPRAPADFQSKKQRKQLHNALLIQVWAALTGIVVIAMIPLIVWLITVPYFVLSYLIWAAVTSAVWLCGRFRVKQLNERDFHKTPRTGADAINEAISH